MPSAPTATVQINSDDIIGEIFPLLFGGFAEHLGRCIYGGIYDPDSPLSDSRGFRIDVLAALREMKLSILRYPGGNFVSTYDWRDGVGPRDQRPRRRDLAWRSVETNQFGTNEFIEFCRELGAQPMLALNLATGTLAEASALIEYCNAPVGTEYADLRARHGHVRPHDVKYWCLGNELDAPWQIGAASAADYAIKARETAKILKRHDPAAIAILCGSSGPWMPTFPQWDRTVLTECWDEVDYLSMHNYAGNWDNDTADYLGYAGEFDRQLNSLRAILSEVKQKRASAHQVYLCWDEWNVWYKDRDGDGRWQHAPHLCEEIYNLEDALVSGQWLNVFLRHCDLLKIACIAQIANAISPILTTPTKLLKQATFYPLVLYAQYARGRSLRTRIAAPSYATRRFGEMPLVDAAATFDPANGRGAVFLIHRGIDQALEVEVIWPRDAPSRVIEVQQIAGLDPKAANSFDRPDVVIPRAIAAPALNNGTMRLKLPPLSLTVVLTTDSRSGFVGQSGKAGSYKSQAGLTV